MASWPHKAQHHPSAGAALTELDALHAAPDAVGRLEDSYIRESAFQERLGCRQAREPSTDHDYSRLSLSP